MIDSKGNNLGFILSAPRSGSTLLSAILGGHDMVHVPNEPWMLLNIFSAYHGSVNPHTNFDHQWALTGLRDFLTPEQFNEASCQFAITAYNAHLSTAGKKIFLDKTPRYFHILPFIQEIFPDAKKIWLKRNPLDVAASYLKTWSITPDELTGSPFTPASSDLTLGLPAFAEFADRFDDVLEIQYEEIVSHPHASVKKVCEHLNLPFEEEIIDYSNSQNISSLQDGELGDKKILSHSTPHRKSMNQWASVLSQPQIQLLVNFLGSEIFERMGYQETLNQLKDMGISFPSAQELADRRGEIQDRSKFLESDLADAKNVFALRADFEESESNLAAARAELAQAEYKLERTIEMLKNQRKLKNILRPWKKPKGYETL